MDAIFGRQTSRRPFRYDKETAALRKRVLEEISALNLPKKRVGRRWITEERCVRDALELTERLERKMHRRDGRPAVVHSLEVVGAIVELLGVADGDTLEIGALHDDLEDNGVVLARMSKERFAPGDEHDIAVRYLGKNFGTRTANTVDVLTKPPNEPGLSDEEKIQGYCSFIRSFEECGGEELARAIIVKSVDNYCNVMNPCNDVPQMIYSMRKYNESIDILAELSKKYAHLLNVVPRKKGIPEPLSESVLRMLAHAKAETEHWSTRSERAYPGIEE